MTFQYYSDGKKCYLDREHEETMNYISQCSALSIHKALMGISELNALEKLSGNEISGGFRVSRAVSTYYTIFHLFTAMMLLDNDYEIEVSKKKIQNGVLDFKVSKDILNDKNETPDVWNTAKEVEQDISTFITHYNIKQYCENCRLNNNKQSLEYRILYENFIKVDYNPYNSIAGLYEKVCYIRDRVIYRPSIVIDEDNNLIQTSLDVRKEIESLPKSNELYQIISKILDQINKKSKSDNPIYAYFLTYLWNFNCSDEENECVMMDDYTKEEYIRLSYGFRNREEELPWHLSHHVETTNKTRVLSDNENYWIPLRNNYLLSRNKN